MSACFINDAFLFYFWALYIAQTTGKQTIILKYHFKNEKKMEEKIRPISYWKESRMFRVLRISYFPSLLPSLLRCLVLLKRNKKFSFLYDINRILRGLRIERFKRFPILFRLNKTTVSLIWNFEFLSIFEYKKIISALIAHCHHSIQFSI